MTANQLHHWADDSDQIELYLLRRMPPESAEHCAAHLAECAACTEKVEHERMLLAGIKQYGRFHMKERLRRNLERTAGTPFRWTHLSGIAASVVIMLVSVSVLVWMIRGDRAHRPSRQIVLQEQTASPVWLMGKVLPKQDPFTGTITDKSWTFRLRHNGELRMLHLRTAALADLPDARKRSMAKAANELPTLLEHTPDGMTLTVYTNESDHSHRAGILPLSSSSFVLYVEGVQIAYDVPDGWL
jgi:hypothetical protein